MRIQKYIEQMLSKTEHNRKPWFSPSQALTLSYPIINWVRGCIKDDQSCLTELGLEEVPNDDAGSWIGERLWRVKP